jgi:hypothetical protein
MPDGSNDPGRARGSERLSAVIAPYVRERIARHEVTVGTAKNVRSILQGFARSYGDRPVASLRRRDVER